MTRCVEATLHTLKHKGRAASSLHKVGRCCEVVFSYDGSVSQIQHTQSIKQNNLETAFGRGISHFLTASQSGKTTDGHQGSLLVKILLNSRKSTLAMPHSATMSHYTNLKVLFNLYIYLLNCFSFPFVLMPFLLVVPRKHPKYAFLGILRTL
jgi:hypothetical protein